MWIHFEPQKKLKTISLIFSSNIFIFQVAPLPEHYIDFAILAGKVAER